MAKDLSARLNAVDLEMQPFWSPRYFKNVEKISKPIHKIIEEKDIYARVRDKTKLCLDVFRPKEKGKYPALVGWSSYGKVEQSHRRDPVPAGSLLLDHSIEVPDIDFFVKRGYALVIPDPRGIGKSEGEWHGMMSLQEQKDLHDIIEWVAKQPWCDGNVGMMGVSYFGHIQPLAATQQPPHLKAIMPWVSFYDYYSNHGYPGGIANDFYHYFILNNNPNNAVSESERMYSTEELKKRIQEALKDPYVNSNTFYVKILNTWPPRYNTWFFDLLLHPFDDEFWRPRTVNKNIEKIKIPIYIMGGHLSLDTYSDPKLKVPKKAMVEGMYPFVSGHPCPYWFTQEEMLRWYEHWLKGVDTGIMDEPPIKLYVSGVNKYRYENEWPLARSKWTKVYLHPYKKLSTIKPAYKDAKPEAFTHVPSDLRTLEFNVPSLVYSTDTLTQPLEVTGPLALYLYSSIDVEDGNYMVNLLDIGPGGSSPVGFSVLRASHRTLKKKESKPWLPVHDHTKAVPVKPGEIYEYTFPMKTSHVFLPGHRMALEIKAAAPAVPRYTGSTTIGLMPSPWVTTYKIFHDEQYPSHLLLPIITETPNDLWLEPVPQYIGNTNL